MLTRLQYAYEHALTKALRCRIVLWEALLTFAFVSPSIFHLPSSVSTCIGLHVCTAEATAVQALLATHNSVSRTYVSLHRRYASSSRIESMLPISAQVYIAYACNITEPGHGNIGPLAVGLAVWALTEAGTTLRV